MYPGTCNGSCVGNTAQNNNCYYYFYFYNQAFLGYPGSGVYCTCLWVTELEECVNR